ncbi:hypothetical protein VTJ83DRAFT_6398 [Remersonia thermophila]|uniref:ORC6 first cyclin-like domain-containing protein n=1 Tax=Remersonia thermophila TaxID=72144 RepID=A0ABR4D4K4_9PEZI
MNRSIEQALLSLLPTHSTAFPEPLTELASSLLAQSRHRASTLKAEEEIARPYACAHLACDRLKTSLNLPPIEPRPPIPPRIYKRLYTHLSQILPAAASTPSRHAPPGSALASAAASGRIRTPSSKLREQQQYQQQLQASPSPLASKSAKARSSLADLRDQASPAASPSKNRALGPAAAPSRAGKAAEPLPRWMRPALRFLLSRLGPASIGPVVGAGLESVVAPRGVLTDDAWTLANLPAVLGALYLFVWRGVTWPAGEDEVDREKYIAFRKDVAACLAKARQELEVPKGKGGKEEAVDEEAWWEGWTEVGPRDLDAAAVRGGRQGWFEMSWAEGVDDLAQRQRRAGGQADGEDPTEEAAPTQTRRADTMFQERCDYLSERKRKAYAEWKQGVLKRIRELEVR